jgi:hypothetical protein
VNAFTDEVIAEVIGTSRRKWALLIVAVFVGAGIALWLTRRCRRPELTPTEPDSKE